MDYVISCTFHGERRGMAPSNRGRLPEEMHTHMHRNTCRPHHKVLLTRQRVRAVPRYTRQLRRYPSMKHTPWSTHIHQHSAVAEHKVDASFVHPLEPTHASTAAAPRRVSGLQFSPTIGYHLGEGMDGGKTVKQMSSSFRRVGNLFGSTHQLGARHRGERNLR